MRRHAILSALALVVILVATLAAGATVAAENVETNPATEPQQFDPPVAEPTAEATAEARLIRRELRSLARAWEEGGGRFGFPFWEKAGQRWTDRQITTPMYREYVAGYRDRLRAGCALLDAADIETSEARDVRSLVLDSCNKRVDALRDQQRWLDELIRRDGTEIGTEDDAVALDERIAERQQAWQEALQESYRDARLAMDLAQRELDESGMERLSEDAFI